MGQLADLVLVNLGHPALAHADFGVTSAEETDDEAGATLEDALIFGCTDDVVTAAYVGGRRIT